MLTQLAGSLALGWTTGAVLDEGGWVATIVGAGVTHLPVLIFFLGLAVALHGLWPKGRGLAWVVFGVAALVAYMGPGIDLPQRLIDASPFAAVGAVPATEAEVTAIVVLTVLGAALLVAGFVGFRRRDVPRG